MEILLATEGSQRAKKAERVTLRLSKAYNLHMAALFAVSFMNAHSASEREKAIKLGEKVLNEVAAKGKKLGCGSGEDVGILKNYTRRGNSE